jgi:hypothetical protein
VEGRLQIGDLVLEPHEYREDSHEDQLHVALKVLVTPEDHARLMQMAFATDMPLYYAVVTPSGVRAEMHLGDALFWSVDSDHIKQNISLVEKPSDTPEPSEVLGWAEVLAKRERSLRRAIAKLWQQNQSLIQILKDKNLLDSDELSRLREGDDASWVEALAQTYEMKDIDPRQPL